jgi:ABC-2 type transport system permease protein
MRRILAQARKEIIEVLRDPLSLALALVLPGFMLILMGTAFSLTVSDMPIVVQDFDTSPASRDFINALRGSLSFRIVPWSVDSNPDAALTTNAARSVLIIPKEFGREVARGLDAPVQLLIDGSDANTAKLVAGYAGESVSAYNGANGSAVQVEPVQAAIRLWYNPGLDSKKFYGPGMFVLVLTLFPTLLAALAAAKEGEQKTIVQVYVSSISARDFLLGKIFGTMTIALMQALILVVLLLTYFGMHFAGDPTPFIASTVLYAFCVGVLVPIETMPQAVQWLSNVVWGTYYTRVMRDAFLLGAGWPVMWMNVVAIGSFGALFYTLAWRNMRRMQVRA